MIVKPLSLLTNYEFDNRYVADPLGNVYIYDENIKDVSKYKKMKPYITRDGYVEFVLTDRYGKKKHIQGQRIIAGLFLPMVKDKLFVNHKNGIRNDNNVANLEWVDRSENLLHSYRKLGRVPWNKKFITTS